jgi:uncharacterized protein (TIGR03086 family)
MPIDQVGILALQRALTQAADLLDEVTVDDLERATPCAEWDVRRLANHVIAAPRIFVTMLQGAPPGWNGREDYATRLGEELRTRGNTLINLWRELAAQGEETMADPDWQAAEVATHTWDLARALGRSTEGLDQSVAERALVAMDRILGPVRKGRAFANARSAPEGSDAYTHLAAYAGREV